MAKGKKKMTIGRLFLRVGFNVVVAGIIFALLSGVLAGFDDMGIVTSIVSLVALLWLVPTILNMRPGQETILSLILGIPAGIAAINLLENLVGLSLPVLQVSDVSLFSATFSLIIASYFAADWAFITFFRRR